MSKERELLEKWVMRNGFLDYYDIKKETVTFLAQSEQEPTTRHVLDSYWNQEAYQRGYAEAKLKLKREPLSKEQYMKFFTDTYDSVNPITDFVRAIEKAHGIGEG